MTQTCHASFKTIQFSIMEEQNMIFGMRAVIEAINADKAIDKVFLQKGLSNELYNQLRNALRGKEIPIQIVPPEKIKRLTTKNHQGVIAFLAEVTYYDA